MDSQTSFRLTPQVVLGLLIVLVGTLLTLDNLDILYARDYLRYWPILLIIWGMSKILFSERNQSKVGGIIITVIGLAFLLEKLNLFGFRAWDVWPIILIIIGGVLIWGARQRSKSVAPHPGIERKETISSTTVSGFALLGGLNLSSTSQEFKGGELTAMLGGCEVDLRQASIKDGDAVIDVFAFWGGIEFKVPEDWTVVLQGTPLLGAMEDSTRPPRGGSQKRLVIKGYAIMGGVEVTN